MMEHAGRGGSAQVVVHWDYQEHVRTRVKRILLSTGRNQRQKMQEMCGWN